MRKAAPPKALRRQQPLLSTAWLTGAQAVFAVVGVLAAIALGWGLWASRHLPFVSDIGTLLAHRDVGDYTLSMSHLFDLTGPSFAALRLPAVLAAITLLIGPAVGWLLRLQGQAHGRHHQHGAHRSRVPDRRAHRLCPLRAHAQLKATGRHHPRATARPPTPSSSTATSPTPRRSSFTPTTFCASPRCWSEPQCSPHGDGSSLLWGSCYPDAPKIFLSEDQLSKMWGTGDRKWLFAQDTNQAKVEQLLAGRLYPVRSIADKALWTDRPLK